MEKLLKNKKFLWGMAIVVGLMLVYFMYRPEVDSALGIGTLPEPERDNNGNLVTKPDEPKLDYKKVLKRGSRGIEVQMLQVRLNRDSKTPAIKEDGIFGQKTLEKLGDVMGIVRISTSLSEYDQFVKKPGGFLGVPVKNEVVTAIKEPSIENDGFYLQNPLNAYVN